MPRRIHLCPNIVALLSDLAGLSAQVGLIRLERALSRKYRPDQPREPAGQPGGGRWISDPTTDSSGGSRSPLDDPDTTGSITRTGATPARSEETVTEDGSRVLTIRIRSNPQAEWDEQHTVTAPDGASTIFENLGLTQTVRDGDTGDIIARNTLTRSGAEPEAFAQDAFAPTAPFIVREAIKAFFTLFTALSNRNGSDGTAIFAAPASEYRPNENKDLQGFWVGRVDQATLDNACPRNGEVQAIANDAAARITMSGAYLSPQDYGNKVHKLIASEINDRRDPNFIAEMSYVILGDKDISYGTLGSIRLDVLEQSKPLTVCVYDHKTGEATLTPTRASKIAFIVQRNFPGTLKIIIIEVRPRPR